MMRTACILGRLCLHPRTPVQHRLLALPRQYRTHSFIARGWAKARSLPPPPPPPPGNRKILLALLSPAIFVQLSEDDQEDGKTPEQHMLEASRAEIAKAVPDNVHGLRRAWTSVYLFLDLYVHEPIATTFRFFHLVLVFVPVIVTLPALWLGPRKKERDNERTGSIWWYGFLVRSMERAGPAFIKVRG